MIVSIKQIVTVKACDLPPTFDVRVGNMSYPFELDGMDESYVYIIDTTSGETVYVPRDEDMTILVPDTWENAKWDISLGLMEKGLI